MQHELKSWVEHFERHIKDKQPCEIRRDDRGFKVGDDVLLCEFKHRVGQYTGRQIERTIIQIIRPTDVPHSGALKEGYCVLGFREP